MGFIDDVAKTVNSGIKQVSEGIKQVQERSQEMIQSVSLQNRLTALEAKKAVALTNLGKLVYDKFEKDDEVGEDVLKRKTTEIAEIEKEIELVKTELNTLKTQFDPNTPQSEKSEHKAGYSRTPGFTCPHCHEPASRDKLFCAFCGGELNSTNESCPEESSSQAQSDQTDSNN